MDARYHSVYRVVFISKPASNFIHADLQKGQQKRFNFKRHYATEICPICRLYKNIKISLLEKQRQNTMKHFPVPFVDRRE